PKLFSQKAGLEPGLVLAPDGSRVFGKHGKNAISERLLPNWEPLQTYEIRTADEVLELSGFSPDDQRLVLVTTKRDPVSHQVRLWDYELRKETALIDVPANAT